MDNATAGRLRGLSNIYNKHKLFHQNKLRRNSKLQNTRIVHFKSPRDVKQLSKFSAQLGLRSELVDWHGDATSVPYDNFLIDLSPGTDDGLSYCTKTGSIPSKFFCPGPAEAIITFGR